MFRFLPEQASEVAPKVDWVHHLITDISVFFTVAIVGSMLYFAIRYRRRDGEDHETPQIHGSILLEVAWTVIPTLIVIYVGYYGIKYWRDLREVPENAFVVNATGQKWFWQFDYTDPSVAEHGKRTIGELYVPVGRPIKIVLQSTDVLHSLFIPAMRVKSDAVPGLYTYVSFTPVRTGEFPVFCTEYCGKDHSAMLAKLHVLPEGEFNRWIADDSDRLARLKMSPAQLGKRLYSERACNSCHSLDGSRVVGPTFLNLYGSTRSLASGEQIVADDNYIRESILNPNAKLVQGFPANMMPAFEGQLADEEITALIAFIRGVTGEAQAAPEPAAAPAAADLAAMSPEERGRVVYNTKLCVGCHSLDGSKLIGPSFKGVFGSVHQMADGSEVTVDEAYIAESISQPNAKVVAGYPPAMPQLNLSEQEIADVTEFIKSLK